MRNPERKGDTIQQVIVLADHTTARGAALCRAIALGDKDAGDARSQAPALSFPGLGTREEAQSFAVELQTEGRALFHDLSFPD